MVIHFTSSSYCPASQVQLFMAKKIYPETGGWFLESYSVMTNFHAKATNWIAKEMNLIAKWTNSIAKETISIVKTCNGNLLIETTMREIVFDYITVKDVANAKEEVDQAISVIHSHWNCKQKTLLLSACVTSHCTWYLKYHQELWLLTSKIVHCYNYNISNTRHHASPSYDTVQNLTLILFSL